MEQKTEYTPGIAGKMATFFLHHKELGFLTIIALFLWGILSFVMMPKQYNPEITAPAFQIMTEFPGATSNEVHRLVTEQMEDRVREIPAVDKVMSQSFDGGMSAVVVQFDIGSSVEDAKVTLLQKLESNKTDKPMGVSDPSVRAIDPDDVPVMTIALSSDEISEASLRALGHDVARELRKVEDTSEIAVMGGRKQELSVTLDFDKLALHGISATQVAEAIQGNNMYVRAGAIEHDGKKLGVTVDGMIYSVKDVESIVLTQTQKSVVYVRDIAQVDYTFTDKSDDISITYKGDKDREHAVYISVAKLKGSNATSVTDVVRERIEQLQGNGVIPGEVHASIVRNDGDVAREATMTLTKNLFSSIAIVSFVLLLFLGWKSALIVFVAIPLTLASVFGIGNLADQTVNRITLFALILSLGILVDAAIVVVENIFRLFRENPEGNRATLIARGVDEVGPGLLMSTTTVILAFVPMAFVTGMMGPYMGPIPFFVPVALIASLLIALMINPFLVDVISRHTRADESTKKNIFLRFMDYLRTLYGDFLTSLLASSKKRRWMIAVVAVLLLVSLSLPALKIVKFRMLPKADTEQFYVYVDLPQYAHLDETQKAVRIIESELTNHEHVRSVQSYVGAAQIIDFNGLFKGSSARVGENQATLKVNLVHHNERRQSSEEITLTLRSSIGETMQKQPDVRLKFIEDPPGPPVLSTFLLKVHSEDNLLRDKVTRELENVVRVTDEVVDVDTTLNEKTAEFVLKVKTEEASRAGVPVYDIAMTLRTMLSGEQIAMYHETEASTTAKNEQEYIVLRTAREQRDEKVDLDGLSVTNRMGQSVPLSALVEYVQNDLPAVIYTDDRKKVDYISAEMGERSVIYGMIDTLVYLVKEYRPSEKWNVASWSLFGVTYEHQETSAQMEVLLDGEWKLTLEVFRDLGIAMGVALIMIYFVLVARFESLVIPALVMGTIPLSFIGVLPGFALLGWTNGLYFNATSMIGVIALSGIVVNNAIIFLEYLNHLRAENKSIEDAIILTGKTRLLPIMMTSLTTILGSLTIISDPVWKGLAWSIIWGLSLSAFLTLVVFPVLYYRFERKHWVNNK